METEAPHTPSPAEAASDPDASLRRAYRRLARLTLERPDAGLRLAALLGLWAGGRAGPGFTLTPDEVRAIFGALRHPSVTRLRRRIASHELRNRCARALMREQGFAALAARMRIEGGDGLRALLREKIPVVAVGWHAGVLRAAPIALRQLGVPTLVAGGKQPGWAEEAGDPLLSYAPMSQSSRGLGGAQFLKRAHAHLAAGGVAFFLPDSRDGRDRVRIPFLGRRFPLVRGAASLARVARARVVPIRSRWAGLGSRIEVTVHEPLPEPRAPRSAALAHETEVLESIARFFEADVRARPETMRLWRWRDFLALPPA